MTRSLALAAAVVFSAGCGETRTVTVTGAARPTASCTTVSRGASSGNPVVELCVQDGRAFRTAFFVRGRRGSRRHLVVPPPGRVGHWERAFLSPDGKTLLAEWSAECETPITFFVALDGGEAHPVAGTSLRDAPVSVAAGWLRDGRALVEFPQSQCGSGIERPGIYAVALEGTRTFLAPVSR